MQQTEDFQTTLDALSVAVSTDVPVLLWGDPGEGRTRTVTALAQQRDWHLEVVVASIREPSDFAGLPLPVPGAGNSMP